MTKVSASMPEALLRPQAHHAETFTRNTEGVCGAVSKGAAGFLRSKGVPVYPIGQPGHCAFVWKHPNGHWQIGNNLGGWNWASGSAQIPWKGPIQLVTAYDSFIHHPHAEESALTYYLSFCTQKQEHVDLLLREARQFNPFNYPAWQRYLDIKAKNASDRKNSPCSGNWLKRCPTSTISFGTRRKAC